METVRLADVAAVLADPSRATMCLALLDGRAWTVGELAATARVAPSTASEHVTRLLDAGFVTGTRQGRHRYVRLTDARVAELVERLAEHAEHTTPAGLRSSVRARRLAAARTCYDHLAGRLGVDLRDGMLRTGLLDTANGLTSPTPAAPPSTTSASPSPAAPAAPCCATASTGPNAANTSAAPCPPPCSTARSPRAGSPATPTAPSPCAPPPAPHSPDSVLISPRTGYSGNQVAVEAAQPARKRED
jgi:DNA-binding transcriptional ArsR family regulator